MGGASRSKGARFERAVVRDLAKWLGPDWVVRRNPADRQRGAAGVCAGDIVVDGPFEFPFAIECKHYADLGRDWLMRPTGAKLLSFWAQAREQADAVSKVPLLIVRQDRGISFAIMPKTASLKVIWKWTAECRLTLRLDGVEEVVVLVPWSELRAVDALALMELHHGRC